MDALVGKTIGTPDGEKTISVHVQDIKALSDPLDVMTISAFRRGYQPVPGTVIDALDECGISVGELARCPRIDLRDTSGVWLSHAVTGSRLPIGRIGCVEMTSVRDTRRERDREGQVIATIQSYFHMLHIAALSGICVERIGLPILGAGNQCVDSALTIIPMLSECMGFLRTCPVVREIRVITNNQAQAFHFALALHDSYSAWRERVTVNEGAELGRHEDVLAFISYSSVDKNVADNLCSKLEGAGIRVWYAPRDILSSDYASAIVEAISRCTHFVAILSKDSLRSQHVLNEVDLAFQELGRGVKIMPLRIDEGEMGPSFRYYLSRQHWMDARVPPLEKRLEEFVSSIASGR